MRARLVCDLIILTNLAFVNLPFDGSRKGSAKPSGRGPISSSCDDGLEPGRRTEAPHSTDDGNSRDCVDGSIGALRSKHCKKACLRQSGPDFWVPKQSGYLLAIAAPQLRRPRGRFL